MTEKLKSKAHPFADHLRRSEKVLWVMPQAGIAPLIHTKRILLRLAVLPLLPAVYVVLAALHIYLVDYYYIVFAGAIILSALGVIAGAIRERLFPHIYALTNERLLSSHRKQVTTYPLEDIQSINIVKDEDQRESLSFSPYFLIWSGVRDAEEVKSLIQNTQKYRMKELQS